MSNKTTSAFQTDLDDQKAKSFTSKWDLVLQLLDDLNDGSKKDFLDALSNPAISAPAIRNSLKQIISVDINRSTISDWRRNTERISKASQ